MHHAKNDRGDFSSAVVYAFADLYYHINTVVDCGTAVGLVNQGSTIRSTFPRSMSCLVVASLAGCHGKPFSHSNIYSYELHQKHRLYNSSGSLDGAFFIPNV